MGTPNGAAGIFSGSTADGVDLYGSIVAENTIQSTGGLANCGGPGTTNDDGLTNVEDGNSCEFEITGNPGLSADLVNARR